jgi:CheY-like chemotaxis protein
MSKTILLADDSVTIQKVVELTFMDQDYEVVAVSNGRDALAKLGARQPALLIADVHMPGADGYEVCRRSKEIYPGLPVLLLVGTFEPFDERQAVAAGADGHLKKPFDSQDLLSQVEALTGGAGAAPAAPPTPPPAPPAEAAAPPVQAAPQALEVSELEPPPLTEDAGATEVEIEPFPAAAAPEPAAAASAPPDDDVFELPSVDEATAPAPAAPGAAPAAQDKPVSSRTAPIELPDWARSAEPTTEEAEEAEEAPAATPPPAAPAPAAAAPAPAETAGGNGSGSLSDQDVDRVARRVAELVGEKLLREVAWEVVPDLAELIIKERIRELESQVE